MKLYPTPPSILTLVTWVQCTQAWPSAKSARWLAFGQTESYSVQPCLPLVATIGPAGRSTVFFYWVRPASLMVGPNIQVWVVLQLLYPTPPSIHSWLGYSARKLGLPPTPHLGWPSAKPNPTVCSLVCPWGLRSAMRADRESFSIECGPHPWW